MSAFLANIGLNILGGVQSYNKNKAQHQQDLAQQEVDNLINEANGELALEAIAESGSMQRRELTFNFLAAQKEAMHNTASSAVQAAWQGIEGATANDIMVSVLQDSARLEAERDEGLRNIHREATARSSQTVLNTFSGRDMRNFTKPDMLATILGVGGNILTDAQRAGKIR